MINTNSNITPITDKQPTPQTKFTIQATLDGFPIVLASDCQDKSATKPSMFIDILPPPINKGPGR